MSRFVIDVKQRQRRQVSPYFLSPLLDDELHITKIIEQGRTLNEHGVRNELTLDFYSSRHSLERGAIELSMMT